VPDARPIDQRAANASPNRPRSPVRAGICTPAAPPDGAGALEDEEGAGDDLEAGLVLELPPLPPAAVLEPPAVLPAPALVAVAVPIGEGDGTVKVDLHFSSSLDGDLAELENTTSAHCNKVSIDTSGGTQSFTW
jgi:hypothetical protein